MGYLLNQDVSLMCFESIPAFSDRLNSLMKVCISEVGDVSSIAILLCGLFSLFYIGNIVWQSWCKGESLNIYALFRPFAIGLLIVNFTTFVGALDVVCGWIDIPTRALVSKYAQNNEGEVSNNLNKLFRQIKENEKNEENKGSVATNVESNKGNDSLLNENDKESKSSWGITEKIEEAVMHSITSILSVIALIAGIGILMVAFVTKLILIYLGPFALALSLIPYFSGALSNWMGRYIVVSLYAPCINIVCFAILCIYRSVSASLGTDAELGFGYFLLVSVASALAFLAIPSIANYVVESAGSGGMTGEVRGKAMAALSWGREPTKQGMKFAWKQVKKIF